MEKALNTDDECAANAADCSVELTQLRGVKRDEDDKAGNMLNDSLWDNDDEDDEAQIGVKTPLIALPAISEAQNKLRGTWGCCSWFLGEYSNSGYAQSQYERCIDLTYNGRLICRGSIWRRPGPLSFHVVHCSPLNSNVRCGGTSPAPSPPRRRRVPPPPAPTPARERSLLFILQGPETGSGKTEVYIASDFRQFPTLQATILSETDANWAFGVKFDGTLAAIRKDNAPIVQFVDGPSGYQKLQYQGGIFWPGIDLSYWDFYVKPNGDIVGCKGKNTDSKSTEIHVLTASSAWKEFGLQTRTVISEKPTATGQNCFMKQNGDLVVVKWWWTGSGEVEVHVATKSSDYKQTSWVTTHTGLPMTKRWSFTMAPNGDIYALRPRSDGYIWVWKLKAPYPTPVVSWKTGLRARGENENYEFVVWEK